MRRFRLGVDVGGTFTDVVAIEERTGDLLVAKVLTTPLNPAEGCLSGIAKLVAEGDLSAEEVSFLVHATTIGTNSIIEGKAARVGLIATAGFSDVLEIAYQTRPSLYDVFYVKPAPLIPRHLCVGVDERMGPQGEILRPLDEASVRRAAAHFARNSVEAVSVCLLHAYRNPAHEERVLQIVQEELPRVPVTISSMISREYKEYPRASTTSINAALVPKMSPYLSDFEDGVRALGIRSPLHLFTSGGGVIGAPVARQQPVQLLESGPAAGVIGAAFIARSVGADSALALDIGGTTAKAAIIQDGQPQLATEFEVGAAAVATVTATRGKGYPVQTPVISLIEIGAGGGSIAHIDPGGFLALGPQSAGAMPGPVCYSQGGTEPTLTDANLVLGRLNPAFFLGGDRPLDRNAASAVIEEKIARPLKLTVEEAAASIVQIADAKMAAALRLISVGQGIDPRSYPLVPSGGGGALHAVSIARSLDVTKLIVPPTPGLNSALGLLVSDIRHDFVTTWMRDVSKSSVADIRAAVARMEQDGLALLASENVPPERIEIEAKLDVSYVGQGYSLRIDAPLDRSDEDFLDDVTERFHAAHTQVYGFDSRANGVRIVNLRLAAKGRVDGFRLRSPESGSPDAAAALKGRRKVYFAGKDWVDCPVYDRRLLSPGTRLSGPTVIEQMDTSTLLDAGARVTVDRTGSLVVELES